MTYAPWWVRRAARGAAGSAAQDVDARVELADHLVHAPQTVAEHRLIRSLAEPLLVGRAVAEQPRDVQQLPAGAAAPVLLVPLAPFPAQLDALPDAQPASCSRFRMSGRLKVPPSLAAASE
jgi:hypothetical protein